MPREAPEAAAWVAIALAAVLTVPVTGADVAADAMDVDPTEAPSSSADELDLAEPLPKLATTPAEREAIHAGHAAGQAWATTTLIEPPSLAAAVDRYYDALALDREADAAPLPADLAEPLATLVTLAVNHADGTGLYAPLGEEQAVHAATLGALDPIRDALRDARHEAPEEPIFVDPLGLIVLGGSGDNTYTAQRFATAWAKGPLLLVEPAGADTYEVPVAAPTSLNPVSDAPVDVGFTFEVQSAALEFDGDDDYRNRTASADLGGPSSQAILVDGSGNDSYGDTDLTRTTAHASPGFAYLNDGEGNDTYYGDGEYNPHADRSGSIAHADRSGRAVLWDEEGDDSYVTDDDTRFTHAMAHSRGAAALLWDEQGNDTYRADLWAFGVSWNDGVARFIDDGGDDEYSASSPGSSFGFHNEELSPSIGDSVLSRGLGEFIDANGTDDYPMANANNVTDVDTRPDRRYGVFIDCLTPEDADRPCPAEQHEARCTMLRDPADLDEVLASLLSPIQDRVDDHCRAWR